MGTAAPGAKQIQAGKFGSFYTPPPGQQPPGMVWNETQGIWQTPADAAQSRFLQEEASGNTGVYPQQPGPAPYRALGAGLVGGIVGGLAGGPIGALYGADKAGAAAAGGPNGAAGTDNTPDQIAAGQRYSGLGATGANGTASSGYGAYPGAASALPQQAAPNQASLAALASLYAAPGGAVDASSINAAAGRSATLSQQYNSAYQNFQPHAAMGVNAGTVGPTTMAASGAPIAAGQFAGAQLSPTQLAERQAAIQAGQFGGAQLAPTTLAQQQAAITAERINASQIGKTNLTDQTGINLGPQAEFRSGQQGLVSGLQGTIAGTDPSVAAIMLRQATDRNIANQYALAQASSGQNAGIASYNANRNVADLNQQAAIQQALLRAQEIATARGQLGGALDQARTGDIGLATNQAGLTQGVNLANTNALNTTAQTNATLAQQAATANAGNSLAAGTTNASLANAVALANASNANQNTQLQGQLTNQAGIANAGNVTQANTATGQMANAIAIANANNANQNIQQQGQLANAAGIANANNTTSANTSTASLANAVALANANNANSNQQKQAELSTTANQARAANDVAQQQANEAARNNLAGNTLTASGQVITGTVGAADAQAKVAQANAQRDAALIGAVATGGSGLINGVAQRAAAAIPAPAVTVSGGAAPAGSAPSSSAPDYTPDTASQPPANPNLNPDSGIGPNDDYSDERKKKDIKPDNHDVELMLAQLSRDGASSFRYKDPSEPGTAPGKRYGVMAQDLEKSPMGRSLVRDTPGGKMVDTGQAALAALAALAAMGKRMDRIEGRR